MFEILMKIVYFNTPGSGSKMGLDADRIQIRIQNTQFNMLAALLDSSRLKKTIFQQFLNFDQKGTLETI